MATYHPSTTDEQAALIRNAPMFFVASADPQLAHGPDGVGPVNVSPKGGVPLHLMAFGLLFASSYFSVITPQGGSQNIIFAASGYLTQPELYELGAIITLAFLLVYLLIGSPWIYFVMS